MLARCSNTESLSHFFVSRWLNYFFSRLAGNVGFEFFLDIFVLLDVFFFSRRLPSSSSFMHRISEAFILPNLERHWIEAGVTDAMFTAQIGHYNSAFVMLQDR